MKLEPDTPVATDAESGAGHPVFRSVPLWLKLGGGILLVCLVLFLIWLTRSSEHSLPPESLLAVETQTDVPLNQKLDLKSPPAIPAAMPPVDTAGKTHGAVLQTAAPAAAHDQTPALTQTITSLKTALTDQIRQHEDWQNQQASLISTLQNQLIDQASKLEHLAALLTQNRVAKAKPAKRSNSNSANHQKRRLKLKVPFDVVSIDQWGDQAYAVLRHNGQWFEKISGQTLLDWHIDSINRDSQTLTVKNPQGHSQTLSITSSVHRQHGRPEGH